MRHFITILSAIATLSLFAGCASNPNTSPQVRVGMTRDELKACFGEPLRVDQPAAGGEDWYYRFSQTPSQPFAGAQTHDEFGQTTIAPPQQIQTTQQFVEMPVHLSPDGHVIPPVPQGRVVKD